MTAAVGQDRRNRETCQTPCRVQCLGPTANQHATDHQPMPLIECGQTAFSLEIQLIRGLQIRDEVRRVVDRLRERVRNLKLIVAAVPLRRRSTPVRDRSNCLKTPRVVLQNSRIDRTKRRTECVGAHLPQIRIPRANQLHSTISEVVHAEVEIRLQPPDRSRD